MVLTGVGRGFCSGADTQDIEPPPNIAGLTLTRIATRAMAILADLVPAMRRMPQPVIAAINGAAIGGGMCLSSAPTSGSRRVGLLPRRRHQQRPHRDRARPLVPASAAIGASRAFEIMLSGRDVSAREAARIGLVSRAVPDADLLAAALDLAEQINGSSTQGVAAHQADDLVGPRDRQPRRRDRAREPHPALVRMTTKNFEEATRARARRAASRVFED